MWSKLRATKYDSRSENHLWMPIPWILFPTKPANKGTMHFEVVIFVTPDPPACNVAIVACCVATKLACNADFFASEAILVSIEVTRANRVFKSPSEIGMAVFSVYSFRIKYQDPELLNGHVPQGDGECVAANPWPSADAAHRPDRAICRGPRSRARSAPAPTLRAFRTPERGTRR